MRMVTADKTQILTVLLIEEDSERAAAMAAALDSSRYKIRHLSRPGTSILKAVDREQPDIIVIDTESPNRDMLDSLHTISNFNPKPIVLFSEQDDTEMINLSVASGVSAYVVGEAEPARVKPILDAAVARFDQIQRLKTELTDTKSQLDARIGLDKAKRRLMRNKGMSEAEAFHAMRKMAMDAGQTLEEVAKTINSIMDNLR